MFVSLSFRYLTRGHTWAPWSAGTVPKSGPGAVGEKTRTVTTWHEDAAPSHLALETMYGQPVHYLSYDTVSAKGKLSAVEFRFVVLSAGE